MFEGTPDPAWEYAPLWEDLRKVVFHLKRAEIKLISPKAKTQNTEIENALEAEIKEICKVLDNWNYGENCGIFSEDSLN